MVDDVPAELDCRNLHRRSMGKRIVGKILGMGSERGMGTDHHAHLFSRHPSGITEMVPQSEAFPYLLHPRLPERPRYIFRGEFTALRASQLCIIPNAVLPIKSVFNSTIRTDSFHYAVGLFDGESFRMWNGGGVNVLYAEGLSAGCASKMDMRGMCASAFTSAVDL